MTMAHEDQKQQHWLDDRVGGRQGIFSTQACLDVGDVDKGHGEGGDYNGRQHRPTVHRGDKKRGGGITSFAMIDASSATVAQQRQVGCQKPRSHICSIRYVRGLKSKAKLQNTHDNAMC